MASYRANPRVLLTAMADQTAVLLNLDTKFYYTLNATGVTVWKKLGSPATATVDELVNAVVAEFDVDASTARADIDALLTTLLDEGMISRA